jgi:4a-hydroxytetrahydrobiopterin dehydratase
LAESRRLAVAAHGEQAAERRMTEPLAEQFCTPCRGGIPPLGPDEARHYLEQAPGWTLTEGDGAGDSGQIQRTFWFNNFRESLDFVRDVGELAESEKHHPEIAFGWGQATISLRTKKIKGLHQNDFIMAVKIDRLARQHGAQENRPERRQPSPATSGIHESNDARGSAMADHR